MLPPEPDSPGRSDGWPNPMVPQESNGFSIY
jgi:hypothetical protein